MYTDVWRIVPLKISHVFSVEITSLRMISEAPPPPDRSWEGWMQVGICWYSQNQIITPGNICIEYVCLYWVYTCYRRLHRPIKQIIYYRGSLLDLVGKTERTVIGFHLALKFAAGHCPRLEARLWGWVASSGCARKESCSLVMKPLTCQHRLWMFVGFKNHQ